MSYCNFRNQEIKILPYVIDNDSIDFIIPTHDGVAFSFIRYL